MKSRFIRSGLMALSASALMSSASAETVAEFVWSQNNGHGFASVDATGAWTISSWKNYTGDALMGAGWSHDGVLYSPWTKNGSVTVYRTSGGALPVLSPETGVGNNAAYAAVTPDGSWCYLLTDVGLYRYDLTQGTAGAWSLVDAQTTRCPRGVTTDEAGHVYVSIRDNGYSYNGGREDIRCYDAETGESVWKVRFVTSDSMNGPAGICWNPQDNYLYWTRTDRHVFRMPASGDISKLESYTFSGKEGGDQKGGWGAGLCVLNGTFYMNYCNTSEGRITTFVWPSDDAAPSEFTGNMLPSYATSWGLGLTDIRTSPSAQWRLEDDEPALVGRGSFRRGAIMPAEFGVKSGAGYFAGPRAYAYLSGTSGALPATGDFTLSFWIGAPALAEMPTETRCLVSNDAGQLGALSVVADQGEANKVGLRFKNADGSVATVAGGTVADGEWHNVTVCRRGGTTLELWLDGVLQGTVAIDAADAVAQDIDWHFGCSGDEATGFVGQGAFLGEIRLYTRALLKEHVADLGKWQVYTMLPSDPGAPSEYDPLPAGYGTEIAHTFAEEMPFGAPGLLVAANGDYYATVCDLCEAGSSVRKTQVFRSTNKGSSWAPFTVFAASGVTLFEEGGVLCAFGQKNAKTFAIWTFAADVWTEAASVAAADGNWRMAPGLMAKVGGQVMKPVVRTFAPLSNAGRIAWVTFSAEGTSFSNGGVVEATDVKLDWTSSTTVKDMLPGHAIFRGGMVHVLNSVEDMANGTMSPGADRMMYAGILFDYETDKNPYGSMSNFKDFGIFRGGSEPFGVVFDATDGLVRSVSVSDGKLVLQASKTCRDWMPCGEVELPAVGKVLAPSIAIDGDDLVMVTVVRCDDGAGGADLTDGGVYLAFRRIANFRTASAPEEPTKYSQRIVYSVNERGSVEQLWKASDGRWYQDATFKKMYDQLGNDKLTSPMGICYVQKHYFLCPGSSSKLYVMGRNAAYQKTITLPAGGWWNEVVADSNGNNLMVRIDSTAICSVDWRNGTAATLIDKDNANWHGYDKIAVARDGTVYACGIRYTTAPNGYYLVDKISRNGTVETLFEIGTSSAGWSGFGGVALDETDSTLYFITTKGLLRKMDLSTKTATVVKDLGYTSGSDCMMLRYFGGKLYFAGNTGKLSQLDAATGEFEPVLGYVYQVRGLTFVDNPKLGATVIIR